MKIDIDNVSKAGRIDKVDLSVNSGDRIALIGPNGSGKSTLLQIIMGIISPDNGKVSTSKVNFGAVFQNNILDETLSIIQNLRFRILKRSKLEDAKEMLNQFQIKDLKQLYGSLSGGQKRIVNFVRIAVSQPNVLLLDELSAGMDVDIKEEAWTQIHNLLDTDSSSAMIYTTHDLGELIYANKVLFIQKGQKKYFGSMKKFIGQMPRYKLIIYKDSDRELEKENTILKTKFFDDSNDVITYLNSIIPRERDFEVKHTSFDDLFMNAEAIYNEN